MKSIFGTASTPFGMCGFGYIDDNDLMEFLAKIHSVDSEGLKKCGTCESNLPASPISRKQALEKVRAQIQGNPQLKIFLSRMPIEERRKFIQNILDSILGLYK